MIHLKSKREIEKMRRSADLVGRTLAEVAKLIRPGVTTLELDKVAEAFVRANGATPAFKGYKIPNAPPFPGTLCTSVNDVIVHGIPTDAYALREGDLVSVDCGVKLDGYYGDSAYTFAVGTLSAEDAQLCAVTYEALMLGVGQAKAGNRIGDISHAIEAHCTGYNYGIVRDLVGHGIGRNLHEDPQVPNLGARGRGKKLKPGLTICIEPMINQGTGDVKQHNDGWTVSTADERPSAHYEHMVVVQRGQAEVLTTFAYIEDVIGVPPYQQTVPATHG